MNKNLSGNSFKRFYSSIKNYLNEFFKSDKASGILLIIATFTALLWFNLSSHSYHDFWHLKFNFTLGPIVIDQDLHFLVNDILMTIFFFQVGLEIKHENLDGELKYFSKAITPIMAALGGMVLPAVLFFTLADDQYYGGWGIPVATDIAFSIGLLGLLRKKVPNNLKVFLTALAIVDDLGAILIIAIFYSGEIQLLFLVTAALGTGLLVLCNRFNLRHLSIYFLLGAVIWYCFYKGGIHPTLAGVILALSIPGKRMLPLFKYRQKLHRGIKYIAEKVDSSAENDYSLDDDPYEKVEKIKDLSNRVQSPIQRIEHSIVRYVLLVIMPLFALANAGVHLNFTDASIWLHPLVLAIAVSLVAGKTLGIGGFSLATSLSGFGNLPKGARKSQMIGLGLMGGIGFTMSLFIAELSFESDKLLGLAKTGILLGSFVAAILGLSILTLVGKKGS